MIGLLTRALAAALLFTSAAASEQPRADPQRFAAEVGRIAARPATLGAVVFTGSSSIRRWTSLRADFPGLPVRNHGFGGSTAFDLLVHFDPLIGRHQPKVVVLYTGSNDIAAGLPVKDAFHDYQALLALIHARLPQARVIINSVKITPSRARQTPQVVELNRRLKGWAANKRWARYVDATSYLADRGGQPRPEYFVADQLHLNAAGYAAWRQILEPVVREEWAKVNPPGRTAPGATPAAAAEPDVPRPRHKFPGR